MHKRGRQHHISAQPISAAPSGLEVIVKPVGYAGNLARSHHRTVGNMGAARGTQPLSFDLTDDCPLNSY